MCQSLESIYLPESLKSLGSHAFQSCLALKSVSMGTGIESAEAGVFKNCSSLESAEVTILSDYMFFGCTSLKHLTFNDIGEEICDHAFEACDSLEEVVIPDGVKIIGESAFDGCSMLSRVEIPEGVTKIDNWAFSKASFTSIDLPESLSELGFSVFAFCDKLESVVLPERVRSIKANLFYKCSSLKDIVIECDDPDRIGADILEYTAFYNNTENWEDGMLYYGDFLLNMAEGEVTEISVREGTTVIASGAFSDKDLITVSLPDSLEVICANVFDEGSAVKYVKYYGNKAQWANVLVAEDNKELKEANVVCMDEHIHTEKWIVVKEATETEAGFKYCICSACGEILCEKEYSLVYSVRLSGNGTEIRYRVGDIVTLSHPLENKDEATGRTYIFAGWELVGIDDEELDLSNNKISFVMPENDVTAKAKTYIIGDVNRDGKLTALDTLALSVAIKDGKTDHIYDVNCDGRVTAIDKLALSKLLKN